MTKLGVYASRRESSLLKDKGGEFMGRFLSVQMVDMGAHSLVWYLDDEGYAQYARVEDVYIREIMDRGPAYG